MSEVKISILTPFYSKKENENFIIETANSIFSQTETNWEWILINDFSEGNEEELLKSYFKDKRVKIFKNNEKGISNALILGLSKATGKFVTRMDADDRMPETKLRLFCENLEHSEVDIVTGKVQYFSDSPISEGYLKYESWLNEQIIKNDFYTEIYRECTVASANWMMEREKLIEIGGFSNIHYPEDYDLLFRWYDNQLSIRGIDEITHFWREHPNRTSRLSKNYQQKAFFELKIHRFLLLDWNKERIIINGTGQKGKLIATHLISKNIPFIWVSHEASKFPKGIFDQQITDLLNVNIEEKSILFNTTLLPENSWLTYYKGKENVHRIINV